MNGEKMRISLYKQRSIRPNACVGLPDENADDFEAFFSSLEDLISALESKNSSEIDRIIEMFDKKPTEPIIYKEFI